MINKRGVWIGVGVLLLVVGALLWAGRLRPFFEDGATGGGIEYEQLSASAPIAQGRRGGVISLDVVGAGIDSFNPLIDQAPEVLPVLALLHATLVQQDITTANIEPALATRWEVNDGIEYTLTLRQGLSWPDGQAFGAEDVVFTFRDVVFNPDVASPLRRLFELDGQLPLVEALNEHTVKFVTPNVYAPFLRWLSFVPILPKHLLEQRVARLHPAGAKQALGKAQVIVQSVLRNRARDAVGEEQFQAIEAGFAQLKVVIEERDNATTQDVARALGGNLNAIEHTLPDVKQAQAASGDVLYQLSLLGLALVNLHKALDQIQLQAGLNNFDSLGLREDTFAQAWPVGTPPERVSGLGPYSVKSYEQGTLHLVRNPRYWVKDARGARLPYLDEVNVRFVDDDEQALSDFSLATTQLLFPKSQDLSLLNGETGVLDNAGRYTTAATTATLGTDFVVFNQDAPDPVLRALFRSLSFRQAVAHTLDRKRLIDATLHGAGVVLDGPIYPASAFYASGLSNYSFDLDQAAALLDGAGYQDRDHDGLREDENGNVLRFKLVFNEDNALRARTAEQLQRNLKQLGVEVSVEAVTFERLLQSVFGGAYQVAVMGLSGGIDPHGGINMWRLGGPLRLWRLRSAPEAWEQRVATLFQQAVATLDASQRQQLYAEFQRLVTQHVPLIYTVEPLQTVAYDNELNNAALINAVGSPLRLVEYLFFN